VYVRLDDKFDKITSDTVILLKLKEVTVAYRDSVKIISNLNIHLINIVVNGVKYVVDVVSILLVAT
jgi:hypothetical protein